MFFLDSIEKSISIILGFATILSFLCRKFLVPKITQFFKRSKNLIKCLRDLSYVPGIKDIQETLAELLCTTFINKHKIVILFENLNVGFYECDTKGEIVWANSAMQDLFNLSTEQMKHGGWVEAFHPDDIDTTYNKWRNCIANKLHYKDRYRLMPNEDNKDIVYCESVAVPIQDSKHNVLSYFGIVHIITKEAFES